MKLVRVKLENFRSYRNETNIDIDDLTVIVGRNDAGKSSILDALDLFFSEAIPELDDWNVGGHNDDIRLTCVFDELPSSLVIDTQSSTDLASEYLLNADGQLEVTKSYKRNAAKGALRSVCAMAVHPTASDYDDLLTLTLPKLKARATSLNVNLSGTNQTVSSQVRQAIWNHASDLNPLERPVELKSEDAGAIWDQLKKHLPVFAVFRSDRPSTDQDAEAQDPLRSAITAAIKTQETELETITEAVKAEVQKIADATVDKIREMNPDLAKQLTPRVTTKKWDSLFGVSLTGDDDIPVNKRGSGTRRLILLNFFRAQADRDAAAANTGVIYAVEEPETSQHPHHQKLLIDAFHDLIAQQGCQVMLTTHTPVLARRFNRESLRLVATSSAHPEIRNGDDDGVAALIRDSLGVLPDHNVKVFLGVEGRNDIEFLKAVSSTLHQSDSSLPDLGQLESQGQLIFVPLGGSSLDLWISRLAGFDRPEFYLMDRDNKPPEKAKYQVQADDFNSQPKCTAWITSKRELENYIHPDVILADLSNYQGTGDDFEDVPELFAKATHEGSGSPKPWADVLTDPETLSKKTSKAKKRLNRDYAAKLTVEQIDKMDAAGELRGWLTAIGTAVLD